MPVTKKEKSYVVIVVTFLGKRIITGVYKTGSDIIIKDDELLFSLEMCFRIVCYFDILKLGRPTAG